jgi:hypothetical protein
LRPPRTTPRPPGRGGVVDSSVSLVAVKLGIR